MREKERLTKTNAALQKNVTELQKQLNKVIDENSSLRKSLARSPPATSVSPPGTEQSQTEDGGRGEGEGDSIPVYAQVDKSKKTSRTSATLSSVTPSPTPSPISQPHPSHSPRPHSKSSISSNKGGVTTPPGPTQQSDMPNTPRRDSDSAFNDEGVGVACNPAMEVVHSHITQCIQELLLAAQAHRQTSFGPCSAKITKAIDTLVKLFPSSPSPQEVRVSLREMVGASQRLRSECTMVSHSDIALKTCQIINSAYDVAKAARHLVLCCEQDHQ